MLFNRFFRIIFFVFICLFVLFTAQIYSEDKQGGISSLNKTLERAEEYEKIISAPNYLPDYKKEAAEKLKELSRLVQSSKLEKRIEEYKNILEKNLVHRADSQYPAEEKKILIVRWILPKGFIFLYPPPCRSIPSETTPLIFMFLAIRISAW
ncbi:MAG: hypothetical protein JJV92_10715 [Desulfosarcina sp.]|nr:hypothetical protein [Desulfobacterales bacterium]